MPALLIFAFVPLARFQATAGLLFHVLPARPTRPAKSSRRGTFLPIRQCHLASPTCKRAGKPEFSLLAPIASTSGLCFLRQSPGEAGNRFRKIYSCNAANFYYTIGWDANLLWATPISPHISCRFEQRKPNPP